MKIFINTLLFTISGFLSFFELSAVLIHDRYGIHIIKLTVDNSGSVTDATFEGNHVPDSEYYKSNNYVERFVKTEEGYLYIIYIHDNGSLLGVRAPAVPHPNPSVWYIAYSGHFFRVLVNFRTELPRAIKLLPSNLPGPYRSRTPASVASLTFVVIKGFDGEIVAATLR